MGESGGSSFLITCSFKEKCIVLAFREPSKGALEATSNRYLKCYSGQVIIRNTLLLLGLHFPFSLLPLTRGWVRTFGFVFNGWEFLVRCVCTQPFPSCYSTCYLLQLKEKKSTQELKSYLHSKWFYHLVILTTY